MKYPLALGVVSTAILAVSVLAAGPLAAQDADQSPDEMEEATTSDARSQIVVRGRPENVSQVDVHRQARDIAVSGNILDVPLARFEDPICPGIIGMQREFAEHMVSRIRDNARYLDLRVQPDGCRANFIVAIVEDGRAELETLIDRYPERFQYMTSVAKQEMLEPGPVHVWTDVLPTTRDGARIGRGRNLVDPPTTGAWMSHSKIYTTLQNDIASVMIFIDLEEVDGLSVGQLADYATMRGLVQTQPPTNPSMDSILEIFTPEGASPSRLTDFDRAYLRAVYDWIPNLPAAAKIGGVNRELRQISEEAAALAEPEETAIQ